MAFRPLEVGHHHPGHEKGFMWDKVDIKIDTHPTLSPSPLSLSLSFPSLPSLLSLLSLSPLSLSLSLPPSPSPSPRTHQESTWIWLIFLMIIARNLDKIILN